MAERVLITGARAPAALDIARSFSAAGFEVHMADCTPSRMAAWSRAVARMHRYPSPRRDFPAFSRSIKSIVAQVQPSIVVPTCEEVFYLAAFAWDVSLLFAPSAPQLRRLHSKFAFAEDTKAIGLATPETFRMQSRADLQLAAANARDLVFKPDYSRFGVHTMVGPSTQDALAITPSRDMPWVAQKRVDGSEVSFYAVSVDSHLTAFSAYASPWKFDGGAGYAFEPLQGALLGCLRDMANVLAQRLIPRGQFACDVIVDSSGEPWLLECNPRATSGAHLFNRSADLAHAMLGRVDGLATGSSTPTHIGPALWSYGLAAAVRGGRLKEWRDQQKRSTDVIGAAHDHAPLAGALIDTMQMGLSARLSGKRLTEVATADIEWNGEDL